MPQALARGRTMYSAFRTSLNRGRSLACSMQWHGKATVGFVRSTCKHQKRCNSTRAIQAQHKDDLWSHCESADYVDGLYLQWKRSPHSIHASWQAYFEKMQLEPTADQLATDAHSFDGTTRLITTREDGSLTMSARSDLADYAKVQLLVRAYQAQGHQKAKIDPLNMRGLCDGSLTDPVAELKPEYYGFTQTDLDREFSLGPGVLPRFASKHPSLSLRDIINICERTYCSSYAVEYLHIADREKCDWIRDRLEIPSPIKFTKAEKAQILDRLTWSATFEKFLATKYPNKKRYGLEGGESLTPGFKALIDRSADEHGVKNIVIGSQHRGRLSIMSNVVRKPNKTMFYEFSSRVRAAHAEQSGDVNTHVGMDFERATPAGNRVQLSLLANPSHLEAENPVAAGKTRAIQHFEKDVDKTQTMCITLHGDAAISGQGVVYETLGLCNLPGFAIGGTVHILVNNQIGFTTDPLHSRSTPYCSDIAKAFSAPIFHVNADDTEAVTFFCQLAADWRATFQTDCVVDFICYRKNGHNEMDQPMFTQPFMYDRITRKVPVYEQYKAQLVTEGIFTESEINDIQAKIWNMMERGYEESEMYEPHPGEETQAPAWRGQKSTTELHSQSLPAQSTAITLTSIGIIKDSYSSIPEGFVPHRNVQRVIDSRVKALSGREDIDWSTAEALAFGSLCIEGTHVRVSGQDVQRGTFSQRHAILHNQIAGLSDLSGINSTWSPLNMLTQNQAAFTIFNSPLSEFGPLGFEYGYSLASPNALVMWEAQFGDFANNAQCIVDQFIASAEAKWLQRSGLVLSLPHGYDGQGPEHSSARLERFLQLCNEDSRYFPSEKLHRIHQLANLQIVYPTTPANLFHILRRQIKRDFRKPLVIFFSKSLLRHPKTRSRIEDFIGDAKFQCVIRDAGHEAGTIDGPHTIKRVILCSGQVYSALESYRTNHSIRDTAVIRIEQLHPFPWSDVRDVLDLYSNAEDITYCQEEPMNGGAWLHVQGRLNTVLKETQHHNDKTIQYIGRDPSAVTATGYKNVHVAEEERIMKMAFPSTS